MFQKKPIYIVLIIIALLIGVFILPALADAGNFSGSSDFGGSSGGSYGGGYSSSWGGSDYSTSSSGGGGSPGAVVVIIVIMVVIFMAVRKKGAQAVQSAGGAVTSFAQLMPMETLREQDPYFAESAMKEKIANLYVQMQDAWENKKFESMRPHMTDALYAQFDRQLQELVREGCTNYIERIAVMDVSLAGWRTDDANDAIVAIVSTRIVDYTVNDSTGALVSGSKTAEKFMTYEWTLIRSKGMKTPESTGQGSEETVTIHCPSCGAPVSINQSAKCPYCDSLISAKDYDWSISAIRGISQRTQG